MLIILTYIYSDWYHTVCVFYVLHFLLVLWGIIFKVYLHKETTFRSQYHALNIDLSHGKIMNGISLLNFSHNIVKSLTHIYFLSFLSSNIHGRVAAL